MRKPTLITTERRRMIVASAVVMNCRMVNVQHLMEDDVLDDVARHVRCVKRLAYDDRRVRRVMMCEDPVRLLR